MNTIQKFNSLQAEEIANKLYTALNCDDESRAILDIYISEICQNHSTAIVLMEVKRLLEQYTKGN
jgi:hypothetical protein